MTEKGRIIEVLENGRARIELDKSDSCENCGICKDRGSRVFIAYNPDCAAADECVKVVFERDLFFKASAVFYGIPLLFLIAGFFTGFYATSLTGYGSFGALAGLLGGIALLAVSYRLLKSLEKKGNAAAYTPVAYKI